jgi:hypothetical protein
MAFKNSETPGTIISDYGLVYEPTPVVVMAINRYTGREEVIELTEEELKVCAAYTVEYAKSRGLKTKPHYLNTVEEAASVALRDRLVPDKDMPHFFSTYYEVGKKRYPTMYIDHYVDTPPIDYKHRGYGRSL